MAALPIGIDLGTTYCAIAAVDMLDGAMRPRIVPTTEGKSRLESLLFFEDSVEETVLFGAAARQKMLQDPLRFVAHAKRHLGNPHWCFEHPQTSEECSASDLTALLIRHLIECAQQQLGTEIGEVVLSVPAYYQNPEKEATRLAGELAGVTVSRLVDEPTAAALAYGLTRMKAGERCLTFDLGGGTFDLSFLERTDNPGEPFRLLAPPLGDPRLGGVDFNECLIELLTERVEAQHEGSDAIEAPMQMMLSEVAERIKRQLSEIESASETLSMHGEPLEMTVTRSEFEQRAGRLLERIEEKLHAAMLEAQLSWDEIDKVILVGGSSRIPAVRHIVERVSGRKPTQGIHPDEAVALGAALAAGDCHVPRMVAHSLGIVVQNNTYRDVTSVLLPRGHPIPCETTRTYQTLYAGQKTIPLSIVQGEETNPDLCLFLDRFLVELPPDTPSGYEIDVTFSYNADGIVQVTAFDPRTEQHASVHVEP